MLKPASPNSPTRPPIEHFYFTIRDQDQEEIMFFTQAYGAEYAAHYWISAILEHPATQNWKDDNTIVFTADNGYTLTVKGSHLEDIIEYQPTKGEQAWTPPEPDASHLRRLENFETTLSRSQRPQPAEPEKSPSRTSKTATTTSPRHRTQKPAPDGQVTVAQLCAEINLAPNKGRNLLRKAKIKKPDNGWTFNQDDPILATIREVLAKG